MDTRKVKVSVTKQDIQKGKRCESLKCPVALALKRTTGRRLRVGNDYVKSCTAYMQIGQLPETAKKFISKFDSEKKVKPFSFVIYLDKNYIKK